MTCWRSTESEAAQAAPEDKVPRPQQRRAALGMGRWRI